MCEACHYALALANIGSASAIEPLYALWREAPGFTPLTEALLILCQLHNVDKPELPVWRRDVIEVDEWQDSLRKNNHEGRPAAAAGLITPSPGHAHVNILAPLSADNHPSVQSDLYSVVLPSKCSLSASASARVWWTTPSR
jgi:hypothetical protein